MDSRSGYIRAWFSSPFNASKRGSQQHGILLAQKPDEPQRTLDRTLRLEQLLPLGGLHAENGRQAVDNLLVGKIRGR